MPACPALVVRRGCAAVAGPAEPAQSGEPGRRGGNASVIKGTRERDSESAAGCSMGHVSETRAWHCKTSLGLASIPQAWPFSGAAHPGGLAWWYHHSHAPHPVTRALPAGQHLWAAGATSTAGMTVRAPSLALAPLAPKSTSQVLHDGFLALLGTCAKHRWLCHDVRV